jgi:hypothetical protein
MGTGTVAGTSVAREVGAATLGGAVTNALAFTGAPMALLSALGAGLLGLGLLIRRLAGLG